MTLIAGNGSPEPLVQHALENIVSQISRHCTPETDPSLGHGGGGVLLFLSYYTRYCPDERLSELLYAIAEDTFRNCEATAASRKAGYLYGAAGTVAVFEHLAKNKLLDSDVHEVFREADGAVINRINQSGAGKIDLGLADGLLGQGIFLRYRINNEQVIKATINALMKMAASIDIVDYIALAVQKNERPGWKALEDLFPCLVLLKAMAADNIYPEISDRLTGNVLLLLERQFAGRKNGRPAIPFNIVYYLYVTGLQPELSETGLDWEELFAGIHRPGVFAEERRAGMYAGLNLPGTGPGLSGNLLKNISSIQQMNRLYWLTGAEGYRRQAAALIRAIIEKIDWDTPWKKLGIAGLSGLGLCLLSYEDKESLSWDGIIALS